MARKKPSAYEQVFDTDWTNVDDMKQLACCDCGLVHDVKHRLGDNGKVQIRMERNGKETSTLRRHYKHEFKKA